MTKGVCLGSLKDLTAINKHVAPSFFRFSSAGDILETIVDIREMVSQIG